MKVFTLSLTISGVILVSCGISCKKDISHVDMNLVPFESVRVNGELKDRILMNFNRLEEAKYHPDNVFLTEEESGGWPGDTEGRTILGLVMNARSSGRIPKYLKKIIDRLPSELNEKGYLGPIYEGKMNEQQLSGNGWMLRGLCEYYEWTSDTTVLKYIESISENLFIAGRGYYSDYPSDPDSRDRNVGGESGTSQVRGTDKWILSSDVGCIFIGMDGAIHAYKYTRNNQLKDVIDEMLFKLNEIDILGINAQTHAILTAARGLVRYSEITGDKSLLEWAEKIYMIYKEHGMTETHGNYNWFNRFDTWTEPCAIVDSYMLAVQLWMKTEKSQYKEDAELIYYNALSHSQRNNGGFGTDNCPGVASNDNCLRPKSYEAHWCCTMRGGEGLGYAARTSAFVKGDTLYFPFIRGCALDICLGKSDRVKITEETYYPFKNGVRFKINQNQHGVMTIKLPYMSWMDNIVITYNGEKQELAPYNGFFCMTSRFKDDDIIDMSFEMNLRKEKTINKENTNINQYKIYYGPLLLGVESSDSNIVRMNQTIEFEYQDSLVLSPIYHLMNEKINNISKNKSAYFKRVLLQDNN